FNVTEVQTCALPICSTAEAFVEYADVVMRALGDRVKSWTTFNEPWVIAVVGHLQGRHAPGHTNMDENLAAGHHVLLAHGWTVPRSEERRVGKRSRDW